jgi:hypothetical protein
MQAFGITLIVGFIFLDGPKIVKNTTVAKYKKFRIINNLVSTNYKGFFNIIWISFCMVLQALWISLIQYLNSSIVSLKNGKYLVTYVIKGKIYKMVVKPVRGPSTVIIISDSNDEDVSYLIFPFLGPEENFHGKIYTPKFFEKEELVFELSNGSEKIFKANEEIILHTN